MTKLCQSKKPTSYQAPIFFRFLNWHAWYLLLFNTATTKGLFIFVLCVLLPLSSVSQDAQANDLGKAQIRGTAVIGTDRGEDSRVYVLLLISGHKENLTIHTPSEVRFLLRKKIYNQPQAEYVSNLLLTNEIHLPLFNWGPVVFEAGSIGNAKMISRISFHLHLHGQGDLKKRAVLVQIPPKRILKLDFQTIAPDLSRENDDESQFSSNLVDEEKQLYKEVLLRILTGRDYEFAAEASLRHPSILESSRLIIGKLNNAAALHEFELRVARMPYLELQETSIAECIKVANEIADRADIRIPKISFQNNLGQDSRKGLVTLTTEKMSLYAFLSLAGKQVDLELRIDDDVISFGPVK